MQPASGHEALLTSAPERTGPLSAALFDVDGVLLASPHEQAWRDALTGFADPARFTTAMYQACLAGKPRMDGARAALEALGVADAEQKAPLYAQRKQARLEELIRDQQVAPFPDALRLVEALLALDWPLAVVSSSKNANTMLQPIRLADGTRLLDAFRANVCGRDVRHSKPNPEIYQLAAAELDLRSDQCLVTEDAPVGIQAARAGGMAALGVARLHDEDGLRAAQADLVVKSLDEVDVAALAVGRLAARRA